MTARQVGNYDLEYLLGSGGMGEVYKAYDTNRNRYVALKLLPKAFSGDPEYLKRFQRESNVAARLREPHVIPIHDFGEIDGQLFIDMRLVDGADIGVLGTDSGTGTGVGVLGTVTNPENSQPAVYGFTQGTGPGVQGESDGPGPGVLGTDNGTGTGYGLLGELTNPRNPKAAVFGTTAGTGAAVEGDSTGTGPGVFGFSEGTGPGVRGASVGSNPGVEGQSSGTGPGVLALNDGSGPALEVQGPATFSRSGLATIAARKTSVTVSFPGVTATSMVLATLQTVAKGVGVAAAVPGVDSFVIKLTKKPKIDVVVAWFVMGS